MPSHSHSFTPSGSISGGEYSMAGGSGTTDYAGGHYHTFTLSGAVSVEKNPTFSGSSGTTENAGSSAAFNVMNPYVVKYCWERTS